MAFSKCPNVHPALQFYTQVRQKHNLMETNNNVINIPSLILLQSIGKKKQKNIAEFHFLHSLFVGLALVGKDIVFRFIIEYSSTSRDFGP